MGEQCADLVLFQSHSHLYDIFLFFAQIRKRAIQSKLTISLPFGEVDWSSCREHTGILIVLLESLQEVDWSSEQDVWSRGERSIQIDAPRKINNRRRQSYGPPDIVSIDLLKEWLEELFEVYYLFPPLSSLHRNPSRASDSYSGHYKTILNV